MRAPTIPTRASTTRATIGLNKRWFNEDPVADSEPSERQSSKPSKNNRPSTDTMRAPVKDHNNGVGIIRFKEKRVEVDVNLP